MFHFPVVFEYVRLDNLMNINIVVIGAGGTGGYVIPAVARMLSEYKRLYKHEFSFTIVDGDVVEEKNLVRQNFIPADIGYNKAQILAMRYTNGFGIPIKAVMNYLGQNDLINHFKTDAYNIVVACVDNHTTRASIVKQLESRIDKYIYSYGAYIDIGNEQYAGHAVCGTFSRTLPDFINKKLVRKKGNFYLPWVNHIFTEVMKPEDKHPDEMSCAERAVSNPQTMMANMTAATLANNFIYSLIFQEPLRSHAVMFDVRSNSFEVRLNTLDNILAPYRQCNPSQPCQPVQPFPPATLVQNKQDMV
jgi:PRTRC genetic system ThiF family protein